MQGRLPWQHWGWCWRRASLRRRCRSAAAQAPAPSQTSSGRTPARPPAARRPQRSPSPRCGSPASSPAGEDPPVSRYGRGHSCPRDSGIMYWVYTAHTTFPHFHFHPEQTVLFLLQMTRSTNDSEPNKSVPQTNSHKKLLDTAVDKMYSIENVFTFLCEKIARSDVQIFILKISNVSA